MSVILVACASLIVAGLELLIGVRLIIIFGGALTFAFLSLGTGPGISALVVSVLAADFFFVAPRFELTADLELVQIGITFAFGAGLSWAIARRTKWPRN